MLQKCGGLRRAETSPLAKYFQELRMEWNKITFLKRRSGTAPPWLFSSLQSFITAIVSHVRRDHRVYFQ